MINTSCTKCRAEIVMHTGWVLEAFNTMAKRTKVKERCWTFVDGRIVNVEPGLWIPEGQTVYKVHICKATR